MRESRGAPYDELLEEYAAAVSAAFDATEVSCASDDAPAEIAETLRATLSSAREQFRQARRAFGYADEYGAYRQTRLSEATQAREQFQSGLQAANAELRAALGL